MAQHSYGHFSGHSNSGSVDPNELAMGGGGGYGYGNSANNASNAYFGDDELLDGLATSPTEPGQGREFADMNMGFQVYNSHQNPGMMDQTHMNGYSNTPDGDPIQSPFVPNFNHAQFRHIQQQQQQQQQQQPHPQSFNNSLQSPISYSGSPMAGADAADGDPNYLNAKSRARIAQMQRTASNNRSPLTPKTAAISTLSLGSQESSGFGPQPIRTAGPHHEKAHSGQWVHTPASLASFPGSGFSSPIQPGIQSAQISDILLKGGTSMPAKLGSSAAMTTQEAKRKRRRESHNLVERRRRDNINERIQDLSRLVPTHRLEDEKVRKLIQNGTPLSPSLTGVTVLPGPAAATSTLVPAGARRAASGGAGNITTGLPLEEKDKGPNKGDILNGAVSWTRDLMWMLHLKLQQQEELMNTIADLGGSFPFEFTEDEKRMQTELLETLTKNEPGSFAYSRTNGSGLRVPSHTDFRGTPLAGSGVQPIEPMAGASSGVSPDDGDGNEFTAGDKYWDDADEDVDTMNLKEEDEYGMDLTH